MSSCLGDLPPGQVQNVHCNDSIHSSRCCAFSLSFQYPSSIIQSMSFCLDLPRFLSSLPSFLPLAPSICRELPLKMCPTQFCLVLIKLNFVFLPPFSLGLPNVRMF